MLFSIVIPTYNRARFIRTTLDSVRAQEFRDYEVIVVDDSSTDETLSILREYPSIRVLQQENKGPGAARNYGVSQAGAEYIAFLDSDDIWFPWTLGIFATLIQDHHAPSVLSARLLDFWNDAELASVHNEPLRARAFPDYFTASHTGYFVGAGMAVVKRSEFVRCGGFTEKRINSEDHDLILRLGTAAGFVQVVAPVTLGWRRHSSSATADGRRNFNGICFLIEQERGDAYPGGCARARQRREIIARHARPTALGCLRESLHREAWQLYRATFVWHITLKRWKFLCGFPVRASLARR